MNANKYKLKADRFEHPAGTVVYNPRYHDYGLAHDDTRATGIPHVSVTLDSDGGYPTFTVPITDLLPVTHEFTDTQRLDCLLDIALSDDAGIELTPAQERLSERLLDATAPFTSRDAYRAIIDEYLAGGAK